MAAPAFGAEEVPMNVLYTIGYEGTDIDRFVRTLKSVGVERLADVRALAHSRKKGFSKKALAARLADEGIEYVHFVALGDPKAGRDAARAGRYEEFRTIYGKHFNSSEAQASIEELSRHVVEAPTCLLCFERDPAICHRTIVAEHLAGCNSLEIFDLYGDDPDRYVRNAAKIPRHHSRQSSAAA